MSRPDYPTKKHSTEFVSSRQGLNFAIGFIDTFETNRMKGIVESRDTFVIKAFSSRSSAINDFQERGTNRITKLFNTTKEIDNRRPICIHSEASLGGQSQIGITNIYVSPILRASFLARDGLVTNLTPSPMPKLQSKKKFSEVCAGSSLPSDDRAIDAVGMLCQLINLIQQLALLMKRVVHSIFDVFVKISIRTSAEVQLSVDSVLLSSTND